LKNFVCDFLSVFIYLPFVLLSKFLIAIKVPTTVIAKIPLSWYADKSFRIIRNDSLDRFGTPLEQRFSKQQISEMLEKAGCEDLIFGDKAPFWRVIAKKK